MRRLAGIAVALSSLAAMAAAQSATVTRTRDASYKLNGVSIWQNGQGLNAAVQLGPQWSSSGSVGKMYDLTSPSFSLGSLTVPSIDWGNTGLELGYDVSAGFGFSSQIQYTGGTADVNADGTLFIQFDRFPLAGRRVGVTVSYQPNGTARFTTTNPDLTASLTYTAGFAASVNGSAAFAGINLFGPDSTIFSYEMPTAFAGRQTINGGNPADLNNNSTIQLLNQAAPFGITFSSPNNAATGAVTPSTGLLQGSAFSPFFTADVIFSQVLLSFFSGPLPSVLSEAFDGSYTIPKTNITASWDLAKIAGVAGVGLENDFTFNPGPTVSFSVVPNDPTQTISGQTYFSNIQLGQTVYFTMPNSGGVTLNPVFTPNPSLRNQTKTGVTGGYDIVPFDVGLNGTLGSGPSAQKFNYEFKPVEWEWTSNPTAHISVDDETTTYAVPQMTISPIEINPGDPNDPTPNIYGDVNSTIEHLVVATPYNGYAYGADVPGPAMISLYPEQGFGFCGKEAGDQSSITCSALTWDGQVPTPLSAQPFFQVFNTDHDFINIGLDYSMLRPGNHTLSLEAEGLFQGVDKKTIYDVAVPVPLPPISLNSSIYTNQTDHPLQVTVIDSTYKGQPLFVGEMNGLLESEVVLDNGIVLPTTKYLNGKTMTTGGGDAYHPVYTDQQEFQWFLSGNNQISFTLSPQLIDQLRGTYHSITLRTKDPFSTGYVTSPVTDPLNKTLYFATPAPTITSVAYRDQSSSFPIAVNPYQLIVKGTNFCRNTTANFLSDGWTIQAPVQYVDSKEVAVLVPQAVLDAQQLTGDSARLVLATPIYIVPNPLDYGGQLLTTPLQSGGNAFKLLPFVMPKPQITAVTPSNPIRGHDVTLTVTGDNFSQGPTAAAQTQVSLNGQALPASDIAFPAGRRGLTSMTLTIPGSMLPNANPYTLKVSSAGGSSTYSLGVDNAQPALLSTSPVSVRLGGSFTPVLGVKGGIFYADSKFLFGGKAAPLTVTDPGYIECRPPALDLPSTTLSILNRTPGGGQTAQVPVTILEGDSKSLTLHLAGKSYNATTKTLSETFTLTYKGNRTMQGTVAVLFDLPAGCTLRGQAVTINGKPALEFPVNLAKSGTMMVTASFVAPSLSTVIGESIQILGN